MLLATEILPEVHDKPRQSLKRGHGGNGLKLQDPAGPFLKQQREAEIFLTTCHVLYPLWIPGHFAELVTYRFVCDMYIFCILEL